MKKLERGLVCPRTDLKPETGPSPESKQTLFPSVPAQDGVPPGWCQDAPPTQSLTGYTTCENKTSSAQQSAGCSPLGS